MSRKLLIIFFLLLLPTQRRSAESLSRLEWIFLGASVLSTCITLGFNIYRFATLPSDNDEFVFAIVVLINLCKNFYF